MSAMKAVRIHNYGDAAVLSYEDAPQPTAAAGELLIQVMATTANPFDYAARAGYLAGWYAFTFPVTLGLDVSGIVAAVGEGVTEFAPGDAVFARADPAKNGAYAEYIALPASEVAHKPASLDYLQAAALPHVGFTAWSALMEAGGLTTGQTVLIHGAAGGVGSLAVQLAKWRGATVIGTASGGTPELVRDGDTGLCVEGGDARALADAIEQLLGDPALRERLSASARRLIEHGVPLVGVNLGRLGFLTDISRTDACERLGEMLDGRFSEETRFMLDAEVLRAGERVFHTLALNDVVVNKGDLGRMIEFDLSIDGEFVYTQRSDGMIVSTPTGSTAYVLSANGPILHPSVGGIALVPLCPHALTARPITIPDTCRIDIDLLPHQDARVHFDGQTRFDLRSGDRVRLTRSSRALRLLHPEGYSYFAMLREKLHWSASPRHN